MENSKTASWHQSGFYVGFAAANHHRPLCPGTSDTIPPGEFAMFKDFAVALDIGSWPTIDPHQTQGD
jgi:hypothetical protein